MNRRHILLTIALTIGAVTIIVPTSQREPAADGKPITYWLENFGDYDSDKPNPAAIALKKIGTNALPWMLGEIKRKNSETKLWFQRQIGRQSLIKFKFKDDDEHRDHAATAFEILGKVAAPAIPELMRLLEAEDVNSEVEQALVHAGSASISPLTNAVVSTIANHHNIYTYWKLPRLASWPLGGVGVGRLSVWPRGVRWGSDRASK